jgi:hypothetical protein
MLRVSDVDRARGVVLDVAVGTVRFTRLRTTAINSFGSAGFDRYIWKPALRNN